MQLDAAHRYCLRHAKPLIAEISEPNAEDILIPTPGRTEPVAASPHREQFDPPAVVRMIPVLVQTQFEKRVLHQLNQLETDDQFLVV